MHTKQTPTPTLRLLQNFTPWWKVSDTEDHKAHVPRALRATALGTTCIYSFPTYLFSLARVQDRGLT